MNNLRDYFSGLGLDNAWSVALSVLIGVAVALLIAHLLRLVSQKLVFRIVQPADEWRDALKNRHVFRGVAWALTVLLCYGFVVPLLADWPVLQGRIVILLNGLLVFVAALTISYAISAMVVALEKSQAGHQRVPFKVMGQALQVLVWSYGSVLLLSVLTERDVSSLLAGMTAIGAVLVYVFRDPILGWMAGIQIAGNDLARYGDWITVPRHDADGQVIDIALTTIKVRNWDNSISNIPSYALVSEGFNNWRGMFESGGRRIKRALAVDANSVRLCDAVMLERIRQCQSVQALLKNMAAAGEGVFDIVADPYATILSYYRRWLQAWIFQHPKINHEMTTMVRELQAEGRGIYVEIYAFSRDQRWEHYEHLQADICDYALAVLPEFGLRVFQEPTGEDVQGLVKPHNT